MLRFTNSVTCALGLLTVFTYVAVYTPLKFRSTLATFIGAFPGAMGPLLGWTAARGRIEWPAVALFAILFVWQFPHFMAIAWLYREDYGRAGIRMLPVVQPDGWSTVVEALVYAVIMIPVSLLPWYFHISGSIYAVAALVLGIGYLGLHHPLREDSQSAIVRSLAPLRPRAAQGERSVSSGVTDHHDAGCHGRKEITECLPLLLSPTP